MTAKTNDQSNEKRPPRPPKNVIHLMGKLACQRCAIPWTVENLNPERKVVKCPVCSFPNDIREAVKRAA